MEPQDFGNDLHKLLLQALQAQDRDHLLRIFKEYPNQSLDSAAKFLEAKEHIHDLAALDCMATALTHGGSIPAGYQYAATSLLWGITLWSSQVTLPEADLEFYLANSSYLIQKALLDTGNFAEGISQYETLRTMNLPGWGKPIFYSTHLQAAENYFENNRSDEAVLILQSLDENQILPASLILYDRLKSKIGLINSKTFQSSEEIASQKRMQQLTDLKRMLAAIRTVMKGYEDQMDMDSIEKLVEMYEGEGDISEQELLELTHKISAKTLETQSVMGGVDNTQTPQYKRNLLTQSTAFFHDDKLGHEEDRLRNCLLELKGFYKWFEERKLESDLAFIAYCQYICYNRLEEFQKAADSLDVVFGHLEKQRASISNIHERAGVFGQYPALFGAMALTNYMSRNTRRLFHRIEASKGRNLTDKVLEATGEHQRLDDPDTLIDRLVPLLSANQAHYLSVIVDFDRSYSVLLTKQGKLFATAQGAGEEVLKDWVKNDFPNPQSWKMPVSGLFGRGKSVEIPKELGKYLDPINFAIDENLLDEGDHIVYSPDGLLNLFTLQIGQLNSGKPLIAEFSVSKIHSGSQLVKLLDKSPENLDEIIGITCSAVQDDADKVKEFEEVPLFLLPEEEGIGAEEEVSIENVLEALGPNKLFHFSTHGVFPSGVKGLDLKKLNPYFNSGLLLMSDGKKPELDSEFDYYLGQNLLSPKILQESHVNLNGSHISMQACVSGRAMEGYGGDALGLEWAFFYCGAQSMLSAAWNVDITWANKLFKAFYTNWIHQEFDMKTAHRQAVLQLMNEAPQDNMPVEYYWGGLSLIGDFR